MTAEAPKEDQQRAGDSVRQLLADAAETIGDSLAPMADVIAAGDKLVAALTAVLDLHQPVLLQQVDASNGGPCRRCIGVVCCLPQENHGARLSYLSGGCCCSTGAAMTTPNFRFYDQTILADPARGDGRDADGRAGDCLRAAAATLLQVEPETLSHYAELPAEEWWTVMQDEGAALGYEWAFADLETWPSWTVPPGRLLIGSGPSPRGDFYHCVIIRPDLTVVHDPHPSRAGLLSIEEFFILLTPADLKAQEAA